MGLADAVRKGVATAAKITKSFQPGITFTPWIGQDGGGNDLFGAPQTFAPGTGVMVDREAKMVPTTGGRIQAIIATVYFLIPVPNTNPNVGQVRNNPIDNRDIIVLDDGTTAPILEAGGFEDAGRSTPFVLTVKLGSLR